MEKPQSEPSEDAMGVAHDYNQRLVTKSENQGVSLNFTKGDLYLALRIDALIARRVAAAEAERDAWIKAFDSAQQEIEAAEAEARELREAMRHFEGQIAEECPLCSEAKAAIARYDAKHSPQPAQKEPTP